MAVPGAAASALGQSPHRESLQMSAYQLLADLRLIGGRHMRIKLRSCMILF